MFWKRQSNYFAQITIFLKVIIYTSVQLKYSSCIHLQVSILSATRIKKRLAVILTIHHIKKILTIIAMFTLQSVSLSLDIIMLLLYQGYYIFRYIFILSISFLFIYHRCWNFDNSAAVLFLPIIKNYLKLPIVFPNLNQTGNLEILFVIEWFFYSAFHFISSETKLRLMTKKMGNPNNNNCFNL